MLKVLLVVVGVVLVLPVTASQGLASARPTAGRKTSCLRFEVVVTYKSRMLIARPRTEIHGSFLTRAEADAAAAKLRLRSDVQEVKVRTLFVASSSLLKNGEKLHKPLPTKPVENPGAGGTQQPHKPITIRQPTYRIVYFEVLVKSLSHEVASESWSISFCHVRGSYATREEAEAAADALLRDGRAKQVRVIHHPNGKVIWSRSLFDIQKAVDRYWDSVRKTGKERQGK